MYKWQLFGDRCVWSKNYIKKINKTKEKQQNILLKIFINVFLIFFGWNMKLFEEKLG